MEVIKNPQPQDWPILIERPGIAQDALTNVVTSILNHVKAEKDNALKAYTTQFEKATLDQFHTTESEVTNAITLVPDNLKAAIQLAKANITKFHAAQQLAEAAIETAPGVTCWRKSVPIEKVGLYIPGGSAPLFSTILMLGIPAKLAGCNEIILCTPPDSNGAINPVILYTANLVGIEKIYKVGGAQAIAAMAYGTESIPQVYKIFGPGNQYVTKAKELVQQTGVSIDMPAGPSEVLIIADNTGNPEFIAADLLSQAEHGADSQVILLSNDEPLIQETLAAIADQLKALPRAAIVKQALKNSKAILFNNMEHCIRFSNDYAPEHLIIASENAKAYTSKITNAGSVFLGNYSCESAGDYASGTNHTLPTNGFAKSYSGVSLDSFVKKISFQELRKEGIAAIGNAIEIMAEAEGLFAHKNAVSVRLKAIQNV
ncbi:MAG: histidinol dehydrogenase [Bacteroidota bacterium]